MESEIKIIFNKKYQLEQLETEIYKNNFLKRLKSEILLNKFKIKLKENS